MGVLGNPLGIAAIVGGVLLIVAMVYARLRNKATGDRGRARTEQATRDLYRDEAAAERGREP